MELTKEQRAQIRESARGMDTAEVQTFETNVIPRLDAMLADGTITHVTTPHVAAACTAELVLGK